jgi:hypothetical protein
VRQTGGYRAYVFDADGILTRRIDIECADDAAATHHMKVVAGADHAELWHGTRLVCVYRHPKELAGVLLPKGQG